MEFQERSDELQTRFRSNLLKKFESLSEGTGIRGNPTLLQEIDTELYITKSEHGEINNEHEVRRIETQSRRAAAEDTAINCSDIFRALPGRDEAPIRAVLTKGVAGIGKTVSVQKFIVDWAEGKENQDVQLIFPLPFRELNLMKGRELSLSDLLQIFFLPTTEMGLSSDGSGVLFIFDGLDECRLSLNFESDRRAWDISESASVEVLLMKLITGDLLPSALIWITSRPAAADLIPSECFNRVTEVRGFTDPQKEQYFRKKIRDQELAERIISHLKSSRSLHIMCHIPVFCWISATVLEKMMSSAESGEIPETLTQMYTHFLIIQTSIRHEQHYEKSLEDEEMILKLGKLAFEQLERGNLIFYEEDLRKCGIDVTEASVYSGLCTQIFREELGWFQGKVFCFVHLSIQEYLAALHAHQSFTRDRTIVFEKSELRAFSEYFGMMDNPDSLSELHQTAVDEALESKNGHLDLLLRFLLGLSLEPTPTLLRALLTQTGSCSFNKQETVEFIQQRIREVDSPERSINLFHCLNELGDDSLMKEIQYYLRSEKIKKIKLSSSQWSALVYLLLTSEKKMETFDLNQFIEVGSTADEALQKLLPVIKESRSLQFKSCHVSAEGCAALASALRSNSSHLRELQLTENNIRNSGVQLLCDVLKDPRCELEKLWMSRCRLSSKACGALAFALISNPSHLRELHLSGSKFGDAGVRLLFHVLENSRCVLQNLRLRMCGVTVEGCAALAVGVRRNPSHLRELDLTRNKLEDIGVRALTYILIHPGCELEKLRLARCHVSTQGCEDMVSALSVNPSHLRELDLSWNKNLGDSGVKILCNILKDPRFKLARFWLGYSRISTQGCEDLAAALRLNPSHLRELDLAGNKDIKDAGVKLFSDFLMDPRCELEKLSLNECGVTAEGIAALASALISNPSHLRELDLAKNDLRDSGMKHLSDVVKDPRCKLQRLWLSCCCFSAEGFSTLASALRSNPSHLRELDLTGNKIKDIGVKLLSFVMMHPRFELEKLKLRMCYFSAKGCVALASALRSNPSHLRELGLTQNHLGNTGVKFLCESLKDPRCEVNKLRLNVCRFSAEGCAALASALRSNPSHLRELEMAGNDLTDTDVKVLSDVVKDPHYKLEKLRF